MNNKLIFSAGGTGGHIIPAIAVADEIKRQLPDAKIHFIGARGRMEMEKVPAAGYPITGLPVMGLQRHWTFKNIKFPFMLIRSLMMARNILKTFRPDGVVGFGGYASGPVLLMAQKKNIPTFIQEQNAFPGITNRRLATKAKRVYTAFPGMEKTLNTKNILLCGNPVRPEFFGPKPDKSQSAQAFGLSGGQPTVFFMGGSQGARSVNQAVANHLDYFIIHQIQVIWQTGKFFYEEARSLIDGKKALHLIKPYVFINNIHLAYGAADLVVARAGAISIAELSAARKACIFVPLPIAAEDHQKKNAIKLVEAGAAEMIEDHQLDEQLVPTLENLLGNPYRIRQFEQQIESFSQKEATQKIASDILKKIKKNESSD